MNGLLAINTEQQGKDAFRLGEGTVLDDLHHAAVDQRQRKSRRSPNGWTWTCSDLAVIINKYDGVIGLLEEINNFIRETFLGALQDQLNEEVRELVSEALGIFTEVEEQLALFDISISDIDCRYNDTFKKYRYRYR